MQELQGTSNRKVKEWVKDALTLAKPYWQSDQRNKSIVLITLVVIFNLLMIATSVVLNKWYNIFYDQLQAYDKAGALHSMLLFCGIAFFAICFAVGAYYFRKILEIRWRTWLTKYYIDNWMSYKAYYKTKFLTQISDNPDQRISEDINSFIVLFLELSLGLMSSIVTLLSFVTILWGLSGILSFTLFGHTINIHGYLVWFAALYAGVGTYITFRIGKPLIRLDFQQQLYEADFRFGLMKVRENSENIALYSGEAKESQTLINKFNLVLNNFVAIIYRQLKLNLFAVGYHQIAIIFPFIVSLPRYFAKAIKLGGLMQIASAFARVQEALSYFVSAYTSLAGFRAVMDRLQGFNAVLDHARGLNQIERIASRDEYLYLRELHLELPDGKVLVPNMNLQLNSGDRLWIHGRSGCGKTTLFRAISGIWGFGSGKVFTDTRKKMLFVTQKPYLPIGTLKEVILYPSVSIDLSDETVLEIMKTFGLEFLSPHLYTCNDWDKILSLGEQQKIACLRTVLNQPDVACLDEATSALDEESEDLMYELLIGFLPKAVIISLGHRTNIKKWHNQELDFNQFDSKYHAKI